MEPNPDFITLSSKVPFEFKGKTLLAYLSGRYPYKKIEEWHQEISAGKVTLNGKVAQPETLVRQGDISAYTTLHPEPWVNKDVKILREDEFLLFADKPAPLPAHADGVFIRNTLIFLLRELKPGTELFLGHRLDRETSGVTVLAKSSVILSALMPLFQTGKVKKRYLAVARGVAEKDEFEISGGMGRDPGSEISMRQKMFPENAPDTKKSRTLFKVLKRLKGYTLLECLPMTGRTNQIRVHLEAVGLPLVGDKLYGRTDKEFLEFISFVKAGGDSRFDGRYETPRHLLHAASLEFEHPITREALKVEAELPEDMQLFIDQNS